MKKNTLLCIAHRGAMGYEPENTLASFRKAFSLGTPCIEIDVRYVDNHLVVFHDERLERTSNGTGYISDKTFEYLRSLDVGNGEKIPTLEEVCQLINAQRCLNIELKGDHTAKPVAELIKKLIKGGWDKSSFLISSFHHSELVIMRKLMPKIKIGALMHALPVNHAKFAEELDAFSVHPSIECINREFINDAHARCLQVFVYGADHQEDIDKMYQLGADGVFTAYPDRVIDRYEQIDFSVRWCDR